MNILALVACQLDKNVPRYGEKEDFYLFMTLTFDPIDPKI